MSIGGENERIGFGGLRVGATVGKPLIVNPTNSEMKNILGFTSTRENEYSSKENNVKQLRVDIWFSDNTTGRKNRCNFWLKDELLYSKENKLRRYINEKGRVSFWVSKKEELPGWFTQEPFWEARVGEPELYNFLRAYTDELPKKYENWKRCIDWNKLIKGDVSELNVLQSQGITNDVLFVYSVRTQRTQQGNKAIQTVYNQDFLPGDMIRFVENPPQEPGHVFNRFADQLTKPGHGCRDFFGENRVLKLAHDYDPALNAVSTDAPLIISQDDSQSVGSVAAGSKLTALEDEDIMSILEEDDEDTETSLDY